MAKLTPQQYAAAIIALAFELAYRKLAAKARAVTVPESEMKNMEAEALNEALKLPADGLEEPDVAAAHAEARRLVEGCFSDARTVRRLAQ